jgi:hypothetical protein
MEARELRIGNWINTIEGHTQIKAMSEEGLMATSIMDGGDLLGWAEPIPLTEEWLLKFGFKEDKYKWFNKTYDSQEEVGLLSYNMSSMRTAISYVDSEDSGFVGFKLKYVHQLQNLYFALTGKELITLSHE